MKLKYFLLLLASYFIITISCNTTEPPIITPPLPSDTIANTITLTVEWTDLYRIKLKWNKSILDTAAPFNYRLLQLDEAGNQTTKDFTITGTDTSYIIGEPDSLPRGMSFWFKVEGYSSENKLKDTSQTITTQTLQPTSHNIVWTVDTLGQSGNLLYDVWGLDENNVWAVGGVNLDGEVSGIIKWDGVRWNLFPSFDGIKQGIFGFSSDRIFVVGEFSNRGVIGIWDGISWTEYRSDYFLARGDTVYPLRAVWGSSPDDVWAVGAYGTVVHWDGVQWKKVATPLTLSLNDIWGTSSSDIYILKTSIDNTSTVAHYDGKQWRDLSDLFLSDKRNLNSFWIDRSGTGYAVGNTTYRYNGALFERIYINQLSYSMRVRGYNSSNVFITGQMSRVYHYNGIDWIRYYELENNTATFSEIRGIQVFEHKVFLVGKTDRAIIYMGDLK